MVHYSDYTLELEWAFFMQYNNYTTKLQNNLFSLKVIFILEEVKNRLKCCFERFEGCEA